MPVESQPLEETEDSLLYTWTIRGLYVTLVSLNIYVLWRQAAGEVEAKILEQRIRNWWDRTTRPVRERWRLEEAMRVGVPRVHFDAQRILEDADHAE